jgi:FAD/FMN-containing dehydrogenase
MAKFTKAHHPLYFDLAGIVGPEYASDQDHVLETYSRDTSLLPPNKQGVVVRPGSTDEVQDIVRLANATKIPIVPSGGRASFFGSPKGVHGRGIVVYMTRMNKMIKIDHVNLSATAEAGMNTAELTTKLWDVGWDVHTAFQPWYSDTLGGQIAGFAGGGAGYELPSAGHNGVHIPGLKVVLGNGDVVQTGAGRGFNINAKGIYDPYPGFANLGGMFIGSSGTFGIITEATYRMYKLSPIRKAQAYYFNDFDHAWECCLDMSTIEPLPYYFIVLIPPTDFTRAMGQEGPMVITIAKGNTDKEVDAKVEIIEECYAKHKAWVAKGPQPEDWKAASIEGRRHREMGEFATPGYWSFFEYYTGREQIPDCHHTMAPWIYKRLKEKGVDYRSNEGCVATGSTCWIITTIIFIKGDDAHARKVVGETFAEAAELAASNGWFPDCHQGWGTRMMAKYWPKEHYQFVKTLKGALDPNNIMNPGIWDL